MPAPPPPHTQPSFLLQDTTLYILQNWTAKYPGEPAFFLPKGLAERVAKGHLGRKSGRGFYEWAGAKIVKPVE